MKYKVENGIYFLDETASLIEKEVIDFSINDLISKGYQYISLPSVVPRSIIDDQDISQFGITPYLLNPVQALTGSAEQGFLWYFKNKAVTHSRYVSFNECFRQESECHKLMKLKNFKKVEQFVFCNRATWEREFICCLENMELVLSYMNLDSRRIDRTYETGYHKIKIDIEIFTDTYGWMEVCSCSYFGLEQSIRFNITGNANHTISCTGVAMPRTLIPLFEAKGTY